MLVRWLKAGGRVEALELSKRKKNVPSSPSAKSHSLTAWVMACQCRRIRSTSWRPMEVLSPWLDLVRDRFGISMSKSSPSLCDAQVSLVRERRRKNRTSVPAAAADVGYVLGTVYRPAINMQFWLYVACCLLGINVSPFQWRKIRTNHQPGPRRLVPDIQPEGARKGSARRWGRADPAIYPTASSDACASTAPSLSSS